MLTPVRRYDGAQIALIDAPPASIAAVNRRERSAELNECVFIDPCPPDYQGLRSRMEPRSFLLPAFASLEDTKTDLT